MPEMDPTEGSAPLVGFYGTVAAAPSQRFDPSDRHQQHLNPPMLFDGRALFTQIIVAPRGRTVWISGLIACGTDNVLIAGGKAPQIKFAFANLTAAIAAAGCLPRHCVRITEYVVDYHQDDLIPIKEQIRHLFGPDKLPTNVVVPVPRLGRDGALFEVDAYCVLPDAPGGDST